MCVTGVASRGDAGRGCQPDSAGSGYRRTHWTAQAGQNLACPLQDLRTSFSAVSEAVRRQEIATLLVRKISLDQLAVQLGCRKPRSRGPSRFDRPIPRSGTPDRLTRAASWAEIGFAPAAIYLCLKQLFRSNRLNAKWLRRSNTASKTRCLRVNSCGYGFRH